MGLKPIIVPPYRPIAGLFYSPLLLGGGAHYSLELQFLGFD
jgi:hypothetical protein